MKTDPFGALIVGGFAIASYQDGAIWTSGVCAGVFIAMASNFVMELIERRVNGQL